jgi:hypothetical protein
MNQYEIVKLLDAGNFISIIRVYNKKFRMICLIISSNLYEAYLVFDKVIKVFYVFFKLLLSNPIE